VKVIYPDQVNAVSADFTNASYPVTNVEDEHPKRLWKSTQTPAILSLAMASGSDTVTLFNTNATSVTVVTRNGSSVTWETGISWESGTTWSTSTEASTTFDLSASGVGSIWSEYTAIANVHIADFILVNSAGDAIYAGIARGGLRKNFKDPKYGIGEGLIDYSIEKQLSNGATYYRKRDVVRDFDFQILLTRDSDFYTFMLTIAQQVGPEPIAWRLSTNNSDFEWVVFCRFNKQKPRGSHDSPKYSNINVKLIEVV